MNATACERKESISDRICKWMTVVLFFILPKKVSRIFVEISIYTLFLKVRSLDPHPRIDLDKLNRLLGRNYSPECVALPSYTLSWFWPEDYLDTQVQLHTGACSLREALVDDEIVKRNLSTITLELVERLPSSLRYKLGLGNKLTNIKFKNNLINMLSAELRMA